MTQMFANDAPMVVPGTMVVPGKGVRPIRCVGCTRDTLPRPDDGAPLCPRCSDVLATALGRVPLDLVKPPRWFWRRVDD
ncbi:hypothetical protein [Kineosporia sp. NBRC 101731]|uniref:hypothetical protein n=1 Tax=Kineosporia sp. NBRC 101731 TaxID=3032199 RepID=UPI0024A058BB|nr:hypothetical protein [Kineosporia sp. NBRC 101731]GLY26698.1 hypothetical protein Kisp02_00630 [Kineosporia sp. NBRC 101731]